MKKIKINSQDEFAKFINLKAKSGYSTIEIAHGAYATRTSSRYLLDTEYKYPIEVEYAETDQVLTIGDIM